MKKLLHLFSITAILTFVSVNVNAQYVPNDALALGDGDNPYVGTEYTYSVTLGKVGNTVEWMVYDAADEYAKASPTVSDAANYDLTVGTASTTVSASLTWKNPGTYYLTYKETASVADGGCSTYRGVVVVVTANSFQLDLLADNASVCNVKHDQVLDYDEFDGVDVTTPEEVVTPLTFTVNMTKDATFIIDSWKFDGTFALPSGITASSITASSGDITPSGNSFTLTGLTAASVTITFNASGLITAGGDITLTASNGAAISGAITTDANASSTLVGTTKLNSLPAASNISFN